jgi:hypothetical protein
MSHHSGTCIARAAMIRDLQSCGYRHRPGATHLLKLSGLAPIEKYKEYGQPFVLATDGAVTTMLWSLCNK